MPPPSPRGFAITITLALVNHPFLLDRFAEEVASLEHQGQEARGAALASSTRTIFERDGIAREQLLDAAGGEPARASCWPGLARESAFKRIAFLQPETRRARRSRTQFADLIFRFRALPALSRELAEGADHLADLSEAEFERFATLQQQVASVGNQHAGDDAGDRDAAERFKDKIAQVMREKGTWRRGHRPPAKYP